MQDRRSSASGAASGQAVVARQIRSALDELGHETFVLARPGSGPRAQQAAAGEPDPVWDQPGVTEASAHDVPLAEYEDWAQANSLEVILFDENYQWEEVGALRGAGIRTIGRFVWEYFAPEHVAPARDAYETIYSLHRAERDRYAEIGDREPLRPMGHPPRAAEAVARTGGGGSSANPNSNVRLPTWSLSTSPAPSSGGGSRSARCSRRSRRPTANTCGCSSTPRSPATTRPCARRPPPIRESS